MKYQSLPGFVLKVAAGIAIVAGTGVPASAQWEPQCSSYCNPSVSCNDECHVEYYITTCGDYDYSNCAPVCYDVARDPSEYWVLIVAIDFYDCEYKVARGYSRYDSCTGELKAGPTNASYCELGDTQLTNSIQCQAWYNQGRVVPYCNW